MKDDLISRQDVIDLIMGDGIYCDTDDDKKYSAERIMALPAADFNDYTERLWKEAYERGKREAQPTLYGYKIEHLAYIATVMEKEGVTAEYAVRTFDDMERVIKMVIEEARAKIEEAFNG